MSEQVSFSVKFTVHRALPPYVCMNKKTHTHVFCYGSALQVTETLWRDALHAGRCNGQSTAWQFLEQ